MGAKKKPRPRPRREKSGKPRQPSYKGGRSQINILLSDKTRDLLLASAMASGRTTSAEAAVLIETAILVTGIFKSIGTSAEDVVTNQIETEMRVVGYAPRRDSHGNVEWLPPNHPANPGLSGFASFKAVEVEEMIANREALGISTEEIERRNAEAIRRSDIGAEFDVRAAIAAVDRAVEEHVESQSKTEPPKKTTDDAA
jgi:hypothetical protein